MKKEAKKALSASMALLMTTSACAMFAGCGDTPDADETTTLGVLPGFEDTTTPESTTTAASTPESTTTTAETTTAETTSVNKPNVDTPVGDYENALTGQPSEVNLAAQRPLAIVVDNVPASYANQTGLADADILYETLVAPGITRFLMVIANPDSVDAVCNIRSGRDYHLNFAAYHNAVLMCHGGAYNDYSDFYTLAKERLGSRWGYIDTCFEPHFAQAENGDKYGTIDNYGDRDDLQYDTIYKPEALEALLSSKYSKFTGSFVGSAKDSLKFVTYGTEKSMAGASDATTVNLEFTCDGAAGVKFVSYKYDATLNKYLRYQDGSAHRDSETGEQLAFTNVITLFTDVNCELTGIKNDPYMTDIDTVGTGSGYYFYGGKVINIIWTATEDKLTLTDPNGNELKLATGNTYIGYLDDSYLTEGKFWN